MKDVKRAMEVLEDIWPRANPLLEERFGRNSCIPTTRVLVEALQRKGHSARALSVRVEIVNPAYNDRMSQLGRGPADMDEALKWQQEVGTFSYGIGLRDEPGRWPGHLVAIIEREILVDMTIEQANHPEYDMILAPVIGRISARFLNGHERAAFDVNRNTVFYYARPGDRSYVGANNWTDTSIKSIAIASLG